MIDTEGTGRVFYVESHITRGRLISKKIVDKISTEPSIKPKIQEQDFPTI